MDVLSASQEVVYSHMATLLSKLPHVTTQLVDFSYVIILSVKSLTKAFGIQHSSLVSGIEFVIEEKLGFPFGGESPIKVYTIFNAFTQQFESRRGIPVSVIRAHITQLRKESHKDLEVVQANLRNCFSLLARDGKAASAHEIAAFQSCFTPEFYPKRFVLKDDIFSQRLDILAYLIVHILRRYDSSRPAVDYVELSFSASKLLEPHVLAVLTWPQLWRRGCGDLDSKAKLQDFFQNPCGHQHLPLLHIVGKATTLKCQYRFLAAFNREKVVLMDYHGKELKGQKTLVRLLESKPGFCIKSYMDSLCQTDDLPRMFHKYRKPLEHLVQYINNYDERDKSERQKMLVVGMDLVGDELGHPYNPLACHMFLNLVLKARKLNPSFGIRIHGGENVPFACPNSIRFKAFSSHMFIVYLGVQATIDGLSGRGVRIGHGIGFHHILNSDGAVKVELKKIKKAGKVVHRNYMLLFDFIEERGKKSLKSIPVEINRTSNDYLIRHPTEAFKMAFFKGELKCILSTDNDGVWPMKCRIEHQDHVSLAAEICDTLHDQYAGKMSKDGLIERFQKLSRESHDHKVAFYNKTALAKFLSQSENIQHQSVPAACDMVLPLSSYASSQRAFAVGDSSSLLFPKLQLQMVVSKNIRLHQPEDFDSIALFANKKGLPSQDKETKGSSQVRALLKILLQPTAPLPDKPFDRAVSSMCNSLLLEKVSPALFHFAVNETAKKRKHLFCFFSGELDEILKERNTFDVQDSKHVTILAFVFDVDETNYSRLLDLDFVRNLTRNRTKTTHITVHFLCPQLDSFYEKCEKKVDIFINCLSNQGGIANCHPRLSVTAMRTNKHVFFLALHSQAASTAFRMLMAFDAMENVTLTYPDSHPKTNVYLRHHIPHDRFDPLHKMLDRVPEDQLPKVGKDYFDAMFSVKKIVTHFATTKGTSSSSSFEGEEISLTGMEQVLHFTGDASQRYVCIPIQTQDLNLQGDVRRGHSIFMELFASSEALHPTRIHKTLRFLSGLDVEKHSATWYLAVLTDIIPEAAQPCNERTKEDQKRWSRAFGMFLKQQLACLTVILKDHARDDVVRLQRSLEQLPSGITALAKQLAYLKQDVELHLQEAKKKCSCQVSESSEPAMKRSKRSSDADE